ncbi:uncharacterized protein NPIL_521071 [Nephila pilipes]|uniref:Uncharacterized protein n=1 Tax=Nephila pilipes TaxID=299642 RepID=A0A8X6NG91_NEPPI|nr:uncharacterized protein NPIL_521071 [Nephila pilipes]
MYRASSAVKGLPPHRRLGQRAAATTRDATLHADGRDRLTTAGDATHRGRRAMAYTPIASATEALIDSSFSCIANNSVFGDPPVSLLTRNYGWPGMHESSRRFESRCYRRNNGSHLQMTLKVLD